VTTGFSFEAFRDLYRHMEWADGKAWSAVLASDAARADTAIRDYLLHIHTVQRMFLALWKRESPMPIVTKKPADFPQLEDLRAWAEPYYGEAQALLGSADAELLGRTIDMPWLGEYEKQMGMTFVRPTGAETMFQVVSHTTHHRAQILTRLRALGAEPPLVDYIAWIWFGRPA
jgi:uncharacterized damage-inducible protein DinB